VGTVETVSVEGKQDSDLSSFFQCAKARASAALFDLKSAKPSRLRFTIDAAGKRSN